MFNNSYQVGRIFGIPIKLDFSLTILALMMIYWYGFERGLFAAAALLLAIVLHELGHSLVAIKMGCRVREITLLLLGGRAMMEQMPRKPWQEMLMALAGPAVSALLGVGALLAVPFIQAGIGDKMAHYVFWHVAFLNIALCIFNLLPAFPMDGGRILRALLQQFFMTRLKATWVASRIGRFVAILMAVSVVYSMLTRNFQGFMLIRLLIAFYIFQAAEQEYRMVQMETAQRGWSGGGTPDPEEIVVSPPPYERKRSFWR